MTRRPRYSRPDLDHLLDGEVAAPSALSSLLGAAGGELAGADQGFDSALTAYRQVIEASAAPALAAVGRARAPRAPRHFGSRIAAGGLAAAAALAVGGVALAAAAHDDRSARLEGSALESATRNRPASPATSAHASGSVSTDTPTSGPSSSVVATPTDAQPSDGSPNPSLVGLCHAWLARPSSAGKADSSAAFTVLVRAAGGPNLVDAYCASLLASVTHGGPASGPPSATPTKTHGKPTAPPGKPTSSKSHGPN